MLVRCAVAAVAVSTALFVVMQAVAGDWLPPEISFSQYGVGPHGWIFSLFLITFGLAPLLLERAVPAHRAVRVLLLVGMAGCLVMALVRTDAGGLQHSLQAKIHMGGAVLGLSGSPLGCAGLLWQFRRTWRPVTAVLVVVSTSAILLLLVTATGVDTLGLGTETSWAVWQTVATLADMVLAIAAVGSVRPVPAGHADPGARDGGDPQHSSSSTRLTGSDPV